MSASRSSAVWWDYRRESFPRPFTIYAGNVEDVSLGVCDFARALTNSEKGTRDAETGRGEGVEPKQSWRANVVGSNGETNGDAKFF